MIVNVYVVGYNKTLNYWKILRKMQKSNMLLETKRVVKYISYVGSRFLKSAFQGWRFAPLQPRQLCHWPFAIHMK